MGKNKMHYVSPQLTIVAFKTVSMLDIMGSVAGTSTQTWNPFEPRQQGTQTYSYDERSYGTGGGFFGDQTTI